MKWISAFLIAMTLLLSSSSMLEVKTSHACEDASFVLQTQDAKACSANLEDVSSKAPLNSHSDCQHPCHIGHCSFLVVFNQTCMKGCDAQKSTSIRSAHPLASTSLDGLLRPPSQS